jgi:hypothetical protein
VIDVKVCRLECESSRAYGYAVALNDNKNEAMERTIEVAGISDDLLARLDQRARQIGVDRNSYLRKLIERAVAPPSSAATLAELLSPIHDFIEAHGIWERRSSVSSPRKWPGRAVNHGEWRIRVGHRAFLIAYSFFRRQLRAVWRLPF